MKCYLHSIENDTTCATERTRCRLFQERGVRTKFDGYVYTIIVISSTDRRHKLALVLNADSCMCIFNVWYISI